MFRKAFVFRIPRKTEFFVGFGNHWFPRPKKFKEFLLVLKFFRILNTRLFAAAQTSIQAGMIFCNTYKILLC